MLLIFNKEIISYGSLYFFSRWIDREVTVDKFHINYREGLIIINDIKIKNPNEFYYDNFLVSEKIILSYNFKSLFSNLIIINNLIVENPKFFLEVVDKLSVELSPFNVQQIYDDNVGGVKKIVKTEPNKIWPTKDKDINFLILDIKINGAEAFIKTSFTSNHTKIDLSNIHFTRIGNGGEGGNYIHHKDALKLIYYDLIARIPNLELKKFLKKIYNYNSLLGAYSESMN
jgi:hypothetical protein